MAGFTQNERTTRYNELLQMVENERMHRQPKEYGETEPLTLRFRRQLGRNMVRMGTKLQNVGTDVTPTQPKKAA